VENLINDFEMRFEFPPLLALLRQTMIDESYVYILELGKWPFAMVRCDVFFQNFCDAMHAMFLIFAMRCAMRCFTSQQFCDVFTKFKISIFWPFLRHFFQFFGEF